MADQHLAVMRCPVCESQLAGQVAGDLYTYTCETPGCLYTMTYRSGAPVWISQLPKPQEIVLDERSLLGIMAALLYNGDDDTRISNAVVEADLLLDRVKARISAKKG